MTDGAVRASDADRERVANQLRDHAAAGRLDPEELGERLDVVYAPGRTLAELDSLLIDLPGPAPLPERLQRRAVARRVLAHRAGAVAISDAACVGIWAATGADSSFWPAWVILFSAIALARDAWRRLGPAAQLPPSELGQRQRGARRRHRARRRDRWRL